MKSALTGNRLTGQLDHHCQVQLVKYGVWVELALGQQLNAPGIAIEYVYFPLGGIIALIMRHAADKPIALGLVGREGMLGIIPAMGVAFVPYSAVVLAPGKALRLSTSHLHELKAVNPLVSLYLERYSAVLHAQFAQAAVCNALHDVQQRLARLLLNYSDRLGTLTMTMTQELLATLLGVRRAGINRAAYRLQQADIVHYSRGQIEILDPVALKQKACDCYQADRQMYESTLFGLSKPLVKSQSSEHYSHDIADKRVLRV